MTEFWHYRERIDNPAAANLKNHCQNTAPGAYHE